MNRFPQGWEVKASVPAASMKAAVLWAAWAASFAGAQVARPPDRLAGQQLAQEGAPRVAACAGCHGATGLGQAAAGFPRLAGLSARYLENQLEAYAEGRRRHPVMGPIAQALSELQRRDAAAHYAGLAPVPVAEATFAEASDSAATHSRAALLARAGDRSRRLQACASCHGSRGEGRADGVPMLAAQHASYLEATLAAWRDGSRDSDPSGVMPLIARSLGADDARALAEYYAALPALPHPQDATPPAPVLAAASAASTPR